MSLFKAREWWTTSTGANEDFDYGCLCVANIDNNSNNTDKIIIGSHQGVLRIYNPRPVRTDSGWSGFRSDDLLLEASFQAPILQVEAGRFTAQTDKLCLAVLHPRKLVVYSIGTVTAKVEHGSHSQLNLIYEHNLQRSAFCMCIGCFGGVQGKDFLAVESIDGTVSVFEHESYAFSRFLPNALLPGPLKYVSSLDAFVTVSSSRQLECYKYQTLAVATDAKTKEESQNIRSGKRVSYDWAFNIGEEAQAVEVVCTPTAPVSIMVLGERNLFSFSETGKLKFMLKLEYNPSCFLPYATLTETSVNYLLAAHTGNIMVYKDAVLKWAAQSSNVPVQMRVANLNELRGAMVCLSATGRLDVLYLGTDPELSSAATPSGRRDIDYARTDAEMKKLQRAIKDKNATMFMPKIEQKEEDVTVQVSINPTLEELDAELQSEVQDQERVPSLSAVLSIKSRLLLNNVRVAVNVQEPISVQQAQHVISSLDPSKPADLKLTFYQKLYFLPADLTAVVTVSYETATGAPRVTQAQFKLPLKLVVRETLPVKQAAHKLTLDTNRPPVNLNYLFSDLLSGNYQGPGAAIGFQYLGGPIVTILAAKQSQRYRVQCDSLEALWLVTNELQERLRKHFGSAKSDFRCQFSGTLPVNEFYGLVDAHFECRQNCARLTEALSQRALQFRAIQRRLLTRFKDKTPAPLQNLDTLLDGTYRQILALSEALEESVSEQRRLGAALTAGARLLSSLLSQQLNLNAAETRLLTACLSANGGAADQGWEEVVDASSTHLLRTCLSKTAKDASLNPAPLAQAKDTGKLKKHLQMLLDRLGKGAKLSVEGAGNTDNTIEAAKVLRQYDLPPAGAGPPALSRETSTSSIKSDVLSLNHVAAQKEKTFTPSAAAEDYREQHVSVEATLDPSSEILQRSQDEQALPELKKQSMTSLSGLPSLVSPRSHIASVPDLDEESTEEEKQQRRERRKRYNAAVAD